MKLLPSPFASIQRAIATNARPATTLGRAFSSPQAYLRPPHDLTPDEPRLSLIGSLSVLWHSAVISMDPFGSHLPALVGCVAATEGRVLELGSGVFSTPVLHAACSGRELLTADNDPSWMQRFLYLESRSHHFALIEDWASFERLDEEWDVAFVDHAPGHARAPSIERLRRRTRLIVIHDTHAVSHYRLEPLLSSFAHRQDFFELGIAVRTTVVSDAGPIPFSIPPATERHAPATLSESTIRIAPTIGRWTNHSLPWPAPGHFFLTGQLSIDIHGDDLAVQAIFLDEASRELFWMDLLRGARRGRSGSFCLAQEEAVAIPAAEIGGPGPQWSSVSAITVRAKGSAASVSVADLSLLALPVLTPA